MDSDKKEKIRRLKMSEASDWTIAVVVKDGTSDWFKRMKVGIDEYGNDMTVNVIQKGRTLLTCNSIASGGAKD